MISCVALEAAFIRINYVANSINASHALVALFMHYFSRVDINERKMFEKSSVHNMTRKILIQVTLSTTEVIEGEIVVPREKGLAGLLNEGKPFIELLIGNNGGRMIATNSIVAAQEVMKAPYDSDNPYIILKLQPGATFQEVRDAWKKRLKACHPDRFAGLDVDEEIQYAAKKASLKINAAYDQICSMIRVEQKKKQAARSRAQEPTGKPAYSVYF